MKRKEEFINDKRRISYLKSIHVRIGTGQSILIEGEYGAGKSRFLNLINSKKLKCVKVESLFNIHEMLASILQELNYDVKAHFNYSPKYLKMICKLTDYYIKIDEANDIRENVWPYLKRIIDAQIPIIFAGLPKVRTYLTSNHPDILSRLKTLILYPITVEDFILDYKKEFESEAIEQIYMATKGDMRKFKEVCADCLIKAKDKKGSFVDVNTAVSMLDELSPVI